MYLIPSFVARGRIDQIFKKYEIKKLQSWNWLQILLLFYNNFGSIMYLNLSDLESGLRPSHILISFTWTN